MAVRYISHAIDRDSAYKDQESEGGDEGSSAGNAAMTKPNTAATQNDASSPVSGEPAPTAEDDSHPFGELNVEDLDKDVDSVGTGGGGEGGDGGSAVDPDIPHISPRPVDLGELLDTVLTILPEDAYNLASLTIDWLTKVSSCTGTPVHMPKYRLDLTTLLLFFCLEKVPRVFLCQRGRLI
jgi:hypothetical protein